MTTRFITKTINITFCFDSHFSKTSVMFLNLNVIFMNECSFIMEKILFFFNYK